MRRIRGLTIIELTISLGVVAILAAIAVPSVGWMVAKSRQSEARSNLGEIRDLETAYHFENKTYGLISQIGFVPDGVNLYGYCAGDPNDAGACVQSATDTFDFASGNSNYGGAKGTPPVYCRGGGSDDVSTCPPPPTPAPPPPTPTAPPGTSYAVGGNPHVGTDDFEADAYGRISSSPPPHDLDLWSIDERSNLENYRVGY